MNDAIKLAIEKGGYQFQYVQQYWHVNDQSKGNPDIPLTSIFQDPLFWQALGKALFWEANRLEQEKLNNGKFAERYDWRYHAHRYFDLVLTGGDLEAYWKELL